MSKASAPRPRYIAFAIEAAPATAPPPPPAPASVPRPGSATAPADHPKPPHAAAEAPPPTRRAVSAALRALARQAGWGEADGPHLTRYAHPHGIVRVAHGRQRDAVALLSRGRLPLEGGPGGAGGAGGARLRTLGASGTLKALTGRLGILRERDT